jgi:hypothetical protein
MNRKGCGRKRARHILNYPDNKNSKERIDAIPAGIRNDYLLNTDFSTLNMEAIRSSETSVHTKFTWRHIPEDGIFHSHRRENLKSYKR